LKRLHIHTGNSSRDDNDVGILEREPGPVIFWEIAGDYLYPSSAPHQPVFASFSVGLRTAGDEIWERSAATPGVLTTSYNANSEMRGEVLRRRDNGC
jgi:hypothetical protein